MIALSSLREGSRTRPIPRARQEHGSPLMPLVLAFFVVQV